MRPITTSEACGGPAFENGIDCPAEPLRGDRQRLGFAVPADELLMPGSSRLTEGPPQMGVTDLGVPTGRSLTCRFMRTRDQPCVGDKATDLRESRDIADFVEDGQGRVLPMPGMVRSSATAAAPGRPCDRGRVRALGRLYAPQ